LFLVYYGRIEVFTIQIRIRIYLQMKAGLLLWAYLGGGAVYKEIEWQKDYPSAQRLSQATGKLMVLAFCVNHAGVLCCGGDGGMIHRFQDMAGEVDTEEFIWVLINDKGVAEKFKVTFPGSLLVVDPEGSEIRRSKVGRTSTMVAVLGEALKAYQAPISWQVSLPKARETAAKESKLLLVLFEDGKPASRRTLEAFGARVVCIYRKRLVYCRLPRESKESQELKVGQSPSIYLLDPKEEKRVLGSALGSRTESQLRSFLDSTYRRYIDNREPQRPEPPPQETPRK
jgi:hypothetical protein